MVFRHAVLDGIRTGAITLALRRWRRPSVKAGGTLLTAVGQLEIVDVQPIALADVTAADARRAGYPSLVAALADLESGEGTAYRISLGALRPDPRVALRHVAAMADDDRQRLDERLAAFDARARDGAWTQRTLVLIAAHPQMRAAALARLAGQDTPTFKLNVRKLKTLGLTESLRVGYRLSPRGRAFLATRTSS